MSIIVPGNSALWTATGFFVEAGDVIKITATGLCNAGGTDRPPFGDPNQAQTAVTDRYPANVNGFAVSGVNRFCLAALVADIPPSVTEQSHDALGLQQDGATQNGILYLTAQTAGQVFLIFNDTFYGDNSGQFEASVSFAGPPDPPTLTATGMLVNTSPVIRLTLV